MDRKYVPYVQIESFYKYVYERRKANYNFNNNQMDITTSLHQIHSPESISALRDDLKAANLTVYEAVNNIYHCYLNNVEKSN